MAQWLTNPTRNNEVAGSVPALAQWLGIRPTPEPQQRGIRATSATYVAACGNTGFLTHPLSEARDGTRNLIVPSRIR